MSEKDVNRTVSRLLKPLDPHRVENALTDMGMPDINISTGWVENKYVRSYPARETTPVRIEHYTDHQRNWADRRTRAGGKVWLVLKVARDWYVFDYPNSLQVGNLTKAELQEKALAWFKHEPPAAEFLKIFQ